MPASPMSSTGWAFIHRVLAVLALAALVSACAGRAPPGAPSSYTPGTGLRTTPFTGLEGPGAPVGSGIRVALLLPLSGRYAELGAAMHNAAEMALFDHGMRDFLLMPIDTQGTPEGAQRAAAQALDNGALLFLGPVFSESVQAVRDQARLASVSIVTFSTNAAIAGNGVYVMGFLPQPQVQRVVDYAIGEGLQRFALLAPDTPYGRTVSDAYQAAVAQRGGSVSRTAFYDPQQKDVSDVVRQFADYDRRQAALRRERAGLEARNDAEAKEALERLKRLDTLGGVDYDAVLLPEGGNQLLMVSSLLSYYDVNPDEVHFLGTGQWDDPAITQEPTLKGAWFAAPSPERRVAFEDRYRRAFGDYPPRIATLAYDSVAMAAVLARDPTPPVFGTEALTNENGFEGIDGIFRFRRDGTIERGMAVIEVDQNEFRLISPAPTRFAEPVS